MQGVEPGDESTLHVLVPSADGKGWCRMKFCAHPKRFRVSAQGMPPGRGNPDLQHITPVSATFPQGRWSSGWDHEHSPDSQAPIPTPSNGQHRATRLPCVPRKPGTGPSTGLAGGRVFIGEACLKQGSFALNCTPQYVWLWANRWCSGPYKVPFKVLQASGLVWHH